MIKSNIHNSDKKRFGKCRWKRKHYPQIEIDMTTLGYDTIEYSTKFQHIIIIKGK